MVSGVGGSALLMVLCTYSRSLSNCVSMTFLLAFLASVGDEFGNLELGLAILLRT